MMIFLSCIENLCVTTNAAVLASVTSKECGLFPNVCSEEEDNVEIGDQMLPKAHSGENECSTFLLIDSLY